MTIRRQDAMGTGEARTQGAHVAALRARLRTTRRTAQCKLGGRIVGLSRPIREGER